MIPYILYFSHYSLIDAKHSNQVVFVTDDLFVKLNMYCVINTYKYIIGIITNLKYIMYIIFTMYAYSSYRYYVSELRYQFII